MFLDNVVTQTIAYEGEGRWKEYVGGYADWQRMRAATSLASLPAARPAAEGRTPPLAPEPPAARTKLTYKETRDLDELPERIEALESEQRALAAQLADPDVYRDDPGGVRTLHARFAAIEGELEAAFARWEALEAKRAGG
jgi:ATP-binding cassette subfamily F protein uup